MFAPPPHAAEPTPRRCDDQGEEELFAPFARLYRERHTYAREWQERTGGKVLGYFCTYVPEEIFYAAGVLPVRILGTHEPQELSEPHIFGMFCSFCRDCLAQGLGDRFAYLDGLMIAQCCLHMRQAFTSWQQHRPVEFTYYLDMPHKVQSRQAPAYLAAELAQLTRAVERWTGRTIGEEQLAAGVAVMNHSRQLMQRLYQLRRAHPPRLSGSEALLVTLALQLADKREHSALLEALLPALERRIPPPATKGVRVLVVGSTADDLALIGMIERLGATIVMDDHCTGSRYFWNEVAETEGPLLEAMARRYCARPPCPSKDWEVRSRVPHLVQLARDWSCQGVLVVQQKFCDPHELDGPAIRRACERAALPLLLLECDAAAPSGQAATRIEAFLELLRAEELF